MPKYHTPIMRIISMLTLAAFVLTQVTPSYALRAKAAGENSELAAAIGSALGAGEAGALGSPSGEAAGAGEAMAKGKEPANQKLKIAQEIARLFRKEADAVARAAKAYEEAQAELANVNSHADVLLDNLEMVGYVPVNYQAGKTPLALAVKEAYAKKILPPLSEITDIITDSDKNPYWVTDLNNAVYAAVEALEKAAKQAEQRVKRLEQKTAEARARGEQISLGEARAILQEAMGRLTASARRMQADGQVASAEALIRSFKNVSSGIGIQLKSKADVRSAHEYILALEAFSWLIATISGYSQEAKIKIYSSSRPSTAKFKFEYPLKGVYRALRFEIYFREAPPYVSIAFRHLEPKTRPRFFGKYRLGMDRDNIVPVHLDITGPERNAWRSHIDFSGAWPGPQSFYDGFEHPLIAYLKAAGWATPLAEEGSATISVVPAKARAQGTLGVAEFEGKVVVVIDTDAINAGITKGDLIRKGFEAKNIHQVIMAGLDVNAIEYGALGLIEQIRKEIERVVPGKSIDLLIVSDDRLLDSVKSTLIGFSIGYVAGQNWEEEFEVIANSVGARESSL